MDDPTKPPYDGDPAYVVGAPESDGQKVYKTPEEALRAAMIEAGYDVTRPSVQVAIEARARQLENAGLEDHHDYDYLVDYARAKGWDHVQLGRAIPDAPVVLLKNLLKGSVKIDNDGMTHTVQ
jgi:hypothetical protein